MVGDKAHVRFVLEKPGKRQLVVIGVNPSTADDKVADRTMTKVMGFAERNGFDGFVMLNLYPQRCTSPEDLDKELNTGLHKRNLKEIRNAISEMEQPVVLVAFGDTIRKRHYLKDCFSDIVNVVKESKPQWKQIGLSTASGNPRHPSRASYGEFSDFNVEQYLSI